MKFKEKYQWSDDNYNYHSFKMTEPPKTSSRRLMKITSYQDLLYKSANRNDYLRLMFFLVRRWRDFTNDTPLTRKECVEYLNEMVEAHGDCRYIVSELRDLILEKNFREDEQNIPTPIIEKTLPETSQAEKNIYQAMAEHYENLKKLAQAREMRGEDLTFPMDFVTTTQTQTAHQIQIETTTEMAEYGWRDNDIERKILEYMARFNLSRNDAIVRIFTNRE